MRPLFFLLGLLPAVLTVQAEAAYTLEKWPDDIAKIPCEEFKKNDDGSWTFPEIVMPNGARMIDMKLKGAETRSLDERCG